MNDGHGNGPTYEFDEAIACINESYTLEMLSEFQSLFKKEKAFYSNSEYLELEARCQIKARILILDYLNEINERNR